MSRQNNSSRIGLTLFGLVMGGGAGFVFGIAFCQWLYAGSGAGVAGGGDGIETVMIGLAFFGALGALAGGSIGGFAGYKAAGADGATSGKKLNPIDELA